MFSLVSIFSMYTFFGNESKYVFFYSLHNALFSIITDPVFLFNSKYPWTRSFLKGLARTAIIVRGQFCYIDLRKEESNPKNIQSL